MDALIAYCGLNCSACDAYLATQACDEAAIERIAARWREEYNAPGITAAGVRCDGCTTSSVVKCGHCGECDIRACGMEHRVANCAHCPDYATCARLARFFGMVPAAKANLDEVRRAL